MTSPASSVSYPTRSHFGLSGNAPVTYMPRPFGLATSASIALSLMRGCAYTTTPVTTHDGLHENLNLSTPSIASTVAGRKSGSLSKKSPFGGGEPSG